MILQNEHYRTIKDLDGTGYPFGLTQNELGFEEKNLSGLDFIKP